MGERVIGEFKRDYQLLAGRASTPFLSSNFLLNFVSYYILYYCTSYFHFTFLLILPLLMISLVLACVSGSCCSKVGHLLLEILYWINDIPNL